MKTSWKRQRLPHFSKLDTHFPSSPARRAWGSSPCPAKPRTSAGLQRGSQPSTALRPSDSPLHNHSTDLPSTAVRRHLGRNREYCFPLPKQHFHFHLLTCWHLVCFYRRVSARKKNDCCGLFHVINLAWKLLLEMLFNMKIFTHTHKINPTV